MTNSNDGHPSPLPDELTAAMHRATESTLNALFCLRKAVRDHVQDERSRGATLAEIDAELRTMITKAAGYSDHPDYSLDRHNELTWQVSKWTESFYSRQGSLGSPRFSRNY